MLSVFINYLTAVLAVGAVAVYSRKTPLSVLLRYFTTLSNLFCAAACLTVGTARLAGMTGDGVLVFKFVATVSVIVTLLTVLIFLGPQFGYKVLFSGPDLFLHLVCPLLAAVSWLTLDHTAMPLFHGLLGVLPVALYGLVYLRKVVFKEAWKDFYGFNRNGQWRLSFLVMLFATAALSLMVWGVS